MALGRGGGESGRYLWRVQLQGTVDARRHARQDEPGVALEAFGAAVDERDDGAGVQNPVFIDQDGDLERTTCTAG